MSEGRQYRIWVPGTPKAKGSPSILRRAGSWRPFVRESPEVIAWQDSVRIEMMKLCRDHPELPTDAPVSLDLTFILPRQQYAPKTKPKTRELAKTGERLSRLLAVTEDALVGELFRHREQIVDVVMRKRVSFSETRPSLTLVATVG